MGENVAPDGPKFTVRPTSKQPRPDQRDSFRIYLSAGSLLQCKLRVGDPCQVQVANGVVPAKTAIAWSATERIQDSVVQTSKLLQELYGLKLGDKVYISKATEPVAEVAVATLEECAQSAGAGDIIEDDRRYWEWGLEYPLCRAEIITVGMMVEQELKGCRRSFRVVDIETATGMGTNTIAQFVGTSKTRIGKKQEMKKEVHRSLKVNTAGIGGVSTQIQQLNEKLRDFSLETQGVVMPSFYKSSGGILLHGPKGTGKSILLSRIESSGWQKVLRVNSSVISRATGDSEATLRKTFAEALRYQPSLIAIDQLDYIAPKRGSGGESASSLASALCECLDSLQDSHVFVVACTRHPNDVDDTLRTPHRLGTEIELPVPTAKGRKEILFALRGNDTEPSDALLDEIAAKTHGYVGADLFSLLQLCCRKALSRHLSAFSIDEEPSVNGDNGDQDPKSPVTVQISEEDVSQALLETRPTAMREVFLETPQVRWSDIGGQHAIKKRLRQAVERPIKVRICPSLLSMPE